MIPGITKILYATDLSKNSAYAFFYAVDMAKAHNAQIVILHSVEPTRHITVVESDTLDKMAEVEKEKQEEYVEEIKKRVSGFCEKVENSYGNACVQLVSNILVPIGHPVEEILKAADDEGCDVIVLGTHGKGVLRHTFLGKVAGSVLERTRKPVFIIPLPSDDTTIDWDKIS